MTKQEEILDYFKDVNYYYNESRRFESLERLLNELAEEKDEQIKKLENTIDDLMTCKSLLSEELEELKSRTQENVEPTAEEVQKYCKKRQLIVICAELYDKFFRGGSVFVEQPWIPVTERLPQLNERVLVCINYGMITVAQRDNAGFKVAGMPVRGVKHWTYLPTKPKKDN